MINTKLIYLKKYDVSIYGRILLTNKLISLGIIGKLLNIISFRTIIAETAFKEENLNFIKSRYYGDRILHVGSRENLEKLNQVSDRIIHTDKLYFNGSFFSKEGFYLKDKLLTYSLNDLLVYIDQLSPSPAENLFIGEDWTTNTPVYNNNLGILRELLFLRNLILYRISLIKSGLETNLLHLLQNFILTIYKKRFYIPTRILYETSLRIRDRFNYLYKGQPHKELEHLLRQLPVQQKNFDMR